MSEGVVDEMQLQQVSSQPRNPDLVLAFGSLSLVTAAAAFLYLHDPINNGLVPETPFLWLTGFFCPGCGATRALHSLLHGEFGIALSFNPLVILGLPIAAYFYLSFLSEVFRGRRFPMPDGLRGYAWVIPAVFIAFWVARNLPWEPFTYLAP